MAQSTLCDPAHGSALTSEVLSQPPCPDSLTRSGIARLQGGTCIIIGDAHEWVAEASRLVQERINCTIFPMEAFYRHDRHSQARPPFTSHADRRSAAAACMH